MLCLARKVIALWQALNRDQLSSVLLLLPNSIIVIIDKIDVSILSTSKSKIKNLVPCDGCDLLILQSHKPLIHLIPSVH